MTSLFLRYALVLSVACSVSPVDEPVGFGSQGEALPYTSNQLFRDLTFDFCSVDVACNEESSSVESCQLRLEERGMGPNGQLWSKAGNACDPESNRIKDAKACAAASAEEVVFLTSDCAYSYSSSWLWVRSLSSCVDLCLPEAVLF